MLQKVPFEQERILQQLAKNILLVHDDILAKFVQLLNYDTITIHFNHIDPNLTTN